jgi:hypothetical protein
MPVAVVSRVLTTAVLALCAAGLTALYSAKAAGPAPGQSQAFGASLAEWQELYWQWAFGQADLPVDANGNAVAGPVVLMPLPDAPGDGTPGIIDVTLDPGQPFVLPLWNILGTSYDDGTPTDAPVPLSVYETLDISLKIDGETVVCTNNVMEYYTAFNFDPEIPLPPEWSPYLAIVWLQGIGTVHPPFNAGQGGQHTITLDVVNTLPVVDGMGNEYFFEYHNTWNVSVGRLGAGAVNGIGAELAVVRQSTAQYHRVEDAVAGGYMLYPGAGGNPGGPDAFYVNMAAIYDGPPETGGIPGVLRLDQPEALAYVKLPNGELRLASVFFFKPYAPWPAPGQTVEPTEDPPVWLGEEPVANVTIGMWEMEVWLWVHNPNGLFNFVNPRFLVDWDSR